VREKVQSLIDDVLGPLIAADGGRIELVQIEGKRVRVRMTGTCQGCPGKPYTIARIVEPMLRRHLGDDIAVDAD
jgi:Fe-S cluster biogenesis protein NfuA